MEIIDLLLPLTWVLRVRSADVIRNSGLLSEENK
jgi:hypothetical protein